MGQEQSMQRKQLLQKENVPVKPCSGCTCHIKDYSKLEYCERCGLSYCSQCTYQYLWLPFDSCDTCVMMTFIEEMDRDDLFTLTYGQLKIYFRYNDIPKFNHLKKHEMINMILTNRSSITVQQQLKYKEKRLKEYEDTMFNELNDNNRHLYLPPAERAKLKKENSKPNLKKLEKYQQERFQLYMMKKSGYIDSLEYDVAIKLIPLSMNLTSSHSSSSLPTSSTSSSSSSSSNRISGLTSIKKEIPKDNRKKGNHASSSSSSDHKKHNPHHKGKQKSTKNNINNNASSSSSTSSTVNPDENTCKICFDAVQSCVLLNCGHFATCYDCAQKLLQTSPNCPICRSFIVRVVKVYKA